MILRGDQFSWHGFGPAGGGFDQLFVCGAVSNSGAQERILKGIFGSGEKGQKAQLFHIILY